MLLKDALSSIALLTPLSRWKVVVYLIQLSSSGRAIVGALMPTVACRWEFLLGLSFEALGIHFTYSLGLQFVEMLSQM